MERQGRLAGRKELDVVGRHDRQLVLGHGHHAVIGAVDGGDRTAPEALARDEPVAEPVVDLALADALLLEPFDGAGLGGVDVEPVQEVAVDLLALAGVRPAALVVPTRRRLHGAHDREPVELGEGPVPLVLGRHRHDGAGAVAHEDVVGHVDRHRRAGERVQHAAPGEGPALVERRRARRSLVRSMSLVIGGARWRSSSTAPRWSSVVSASSRGCSGATTA